MDSKFLKATLLISLLFMVTLFFIVLYSNGMGPGQQKDKPVAEIKEDKVIVLEGQIGNDLYGWMEDESFFDKAPEKPEKEEEDGMTRVNLIASSVQKDMRVKIVDKSGEPVKGQFFKILINEQDEYKDLDRDGIIYVADLDPGEYQVSMQEQAGFVVPKSSMPVSVKAKVEYTAIPDISLMIKTEEQVDAMAEDAGRKNNTQNQNEPTELRKIANAKLGIDVSRWNEEIDWNKVKNAGINYAILRVGYRGSVTGVLVEDWYYKKNIEGAAAAGVPVGLYFFTQAVNEVEAVEEASMVLSQIKGYKITYPVFIDVESSGGRADGLDSGTRTRVINAFCQTIQNGGYRAGIYANKTWLAQKMNISALSGYKIWLAQYNTQVTYGGRYDMWQYSDKGSISGISGKVDMNLSYMNY